MVLTIGFLGVVPRPPPRPGLPDTAGEVTPARGSLRLAAIEIIRIRYFTADVSGRRDAAKPIRQQAYLRALSTIPQLSIHKGKFQFSTKWMAVATPPTDFVKPIPVTALVVKTEEKGSDVNLGAYLVRDAFRGEFDVAAVVSNDTDLVEPIRIVAGEVGNPRPGFFRETASDQVMEKVDQQGNLLGFSVLKVSTLRETPLEVVL